MCTGGQVRVSHDTPTHIHTHTRTHARTREPSHFNTSAHRACCSCTSAYSEVFDFLFFLRIISVWERLHVDMGVRCGVCRGGDKVSNLDSFNIWLRRSAYSSSDICVRVGVRVRV